MLYHNSGRISYEVIVVDNASYDGCDEMLRREFGNVRFIQLTENGGFAQGNNLAFRQSVGDKILFLNPDTEVLPNAVALMSDAMDECADAGAIGPRLLNTDGSVQVSVQAFPTILNQMLDADLLRKLFPASFLWGASALKVAGKKAVQVAALSGACIMVRRSAFESVGMFSERYFMYAEDVDLCYKLKRANWNRLYLSTAAVIHHGGQSSISTSKRNFVSVLQRQSRFEYFRHYKGRSYAFLYRIGMGIAAGIRIALLTMVLPFSDRKRQSLRTATSRWNAILRWSAGFENWARETTSSLAYRE